MFNREEARTIFDNIFWILFIYLLLKITENFKLQTKSKTPKTVKRFNIKASKIQSQQNCYWYQNINNCIYLQPKTYFYRSKNISFFMAPFKNIYSVNIFWYSHYQNALVQRCIKQYWKQNCKHIKHNKKKIYVHTGTYIGRYIEKVILFLKFKIATSKCNFPNSFYDFKTLNSLTKLSIVHVTFSRKYFNYFLQ